MKKEISNEIFLMRSISCLAIVLLHSVSSAIHVFEDQNSPEISAILTGITMGLLFGTPVFVFISEFLLAKSYPHKLPNGFFKKRVKFLLIPYAMMGVVYAVVEFDSRTQSLSSLLAQVFKNIFLANYTGYFVLIIFQFYILHFVLIPYLNKWSPKILIPTALVINLLYLSFFNFVNPFDFLPYSEYIWYHLSWMPFVGWIFYFTLGYYCGKNYTQFKEILFKFRKWLVPGVVSSLALMLFLQLSGILDLTSSKRVDIVIYTTFVIFFIFYIATKVKTMPNLIFLLSNYSFGIYLLHKIFMHYIEKINLFSNVYLYITIVFIASLFFSIFVTYLLNKIRFGNYIVGNIGNYSMKSNKEVKQKPA